MLNRFFGAILGAALITSASAQELKRPETIGGHPNFNGICQGNEDLLMVYPFAATNRIIYMNDPSEAAVDTYMGKSSGAWDGNVLVVTTIDQNDKTWLDRAG